MEGGGARYVIDEAQSGLGSLLKIADVFEDPDLGCDSKAGVARAKGDKKCEYVFSDTVAGRTIRLTYQKSYSNEIEADTDNRSMAHIVEQIPDIVMTITENSGEKNSYTYLFDAKYQIMPLPSVEDPQTDAAPYRTINEMHRYRDAILYRRQKAGGDDKGKLTHEVIGAYVLYPGRPDKSFNYKRFIEEENIGAIPLLPGIDGTKVLYEFLDYVLKHQDAQSHLGTAIPTRGTTMVVGEGFSEKSIPTIELKPDEWPEWSGVGEKFVDVPASQLDKIPNQLPTLVRLKSDDKVEMIVKFVEKHSGNSYKVKRTEPVSWVNS
jgi:hypothetical protein